ncbi:MAG TPA: hypothetical protein VLX68_12030 [Chitinivibrionales bacterium]|nr:hypothetical protein [Chitinivibrionales bacterium]
MKKSFLIILSIYITLAFSDQLEFEGAIPPDVNTAALTADYYRIYHLVAPRQRPDERPLRIVYYSEKSKENFDDVLPEWGGGGAIGGDLIVIPTKFKPFLDQSFSQITRHELVHAVLARAYPGVAIPRWFHEGVAMTLSGEIGFQENVVVSAAIFTGSLMPLSSIDSVNSYGRNRADLAYCQSHLAVLFLIDQCGIEVVPDLLIMARKTTSFWKGLHAVLGVTPNEFEALYRKDISSRFQLAFVFADYYAFWVAVALLFLVAAGVAIVRKQKKLAQMEREEAMDDDAAPPRPLPPDPPAGTRPPPAPFDHGGQPEEQIDMGEDLYPEDEWEDEEDDEDDDDYILSDGVELEDEEDDDEFYDEEEDDEDFGSEEDGGTQKK